MEECLVGVVPRYVVTVVDGNTSAQPKVGYGVIGAKYRNCRDPACGCYIEYGGDCCLHNDGDLIFRCKRGLSKTGPRRSSLTMECGRPGRCALGWWRSPGQRTIGAGPS